MKHLLFTLLLVTQGAFALTEKNSDLFEELQSMDALLFERAFNKCELNILDEILHPGLEFYHDQSGRQDRATFIQSTQDNICSSLDRKPLRKLLKGSLSVFEMKNAGKTYAALQSGEHEFFIKETGKSKYKTSIAKFTNLWVKVDNAWKLKRAYSFDHQKPKKIYPDLETENQFSIGDNKPLFKYDSEIRTLLAENKIPSVAIGVIENGQLQQVRVFGDQKNHLQPSMQGLYNVASLTKPVVALVVLKLVDSGRWDLDDPLAKFYIDQDLQGDVLLNTLTTRHVLSHQSGFANWRHLSSDNKLSFQFAPGTQYQYSGEGFEYLRRSVEAKFNRPFEEIATQELFAPLGMQDTHFYWTDHVDSQRYQAEHDENGQALSLEKHVDANAADNLITSAEDYGKFMVHILQGADISKDLYNDMVAKQVAVKEGVDFSLGWERFNDLSLSKSEPEFALQHTGSDKGTKAIAVMLPNTKRGLLVLSNSENAGVLWPKILMEYFGEVGENLISANMR